jgi:hypothetical protein
MSHENSIHSLDRIARSALAVSCGMTSAEAGGELDVVETAQAGVTIQSQTCDPVVQVYPVRGPHNHGFDEQAGNASLWTCSAAPTAPGPLSATSKRSPEIPAASPAPASPVTDVRRDHGGSLALHHQVRRGVGVLLVRVADLASSQPVREREQPTI